jgi:hypothetical protein
MPQPILAFPDDIQEYSPIDPEDYLKGAKHTYKGFEHGPYLTRTGIQKHKVNRAQDRSAFIKPDKLRETAISHIDEIDLEKVCPIFCHVEYTLSVTIL